MKGILSATPAPSGIRLLVGSQLLFLVQAGLVLRSQSPLDVMLHAIVLLVATTGLAALITAVAGEPREPVADPRRRYRHGR